MDGWTHRWMDKPTVGWRGRHLDGWKEGWMDDHTDGMDGQTEGWND